jgi:hypothetical protein
MVVYNSLIKLIDSDLYTELIAFRNSLPPSSMKIRDTDVAVFDKYLVDNGSNPSI